MENFCYWQENLPNHFKQFKNITNVSSKICLLRQNEYKIFKETENGEEIIKKINIFCPYINVEQAKECEDYNLIKEIK